MTSATASTSVGIETRSTCPYCGVGCGVIISATGDQITGVRGDPDHPANLGRLCTKGSTLHLTASAEITRHQRLLQPMQRMQRGRAPQVVSWDQALNHAADAFAHIIDEQGPNAVGFYVSGQLLTEDYYVFNKLAKGLIGTNNIDTNSRLCMSSAVAGYKQTLGADAPPACYDDVQHAQCIFIVGSNTAYAHPILFRRIEDAKKANPELKIIYCDPRKTDTAEIADLHLPLQPGTDVMLFNGMLHIMLWEGWTSAAYIAAHTTGFEALKAIVRDYTPERVALSCGIAQADLHAAARLFATSAATLSLYCQGLNQSTSGTAKNAALINLHLATAHIGKPGAGPFSLTGQPNAMGGREVGGLANLLSAHRDMGNVAHRAEVAALWGVPSVPSEPGKTAVEMFQAAADGQIKALWIACTNPAQSMPDQATVRRALERAELVVVQEAFATTATCAYADILLPATTWGEKDGTVTNSERAISRVRPAIARPGNSRHDWSIAVDFGQRLQSRLTPQATAPSLFAYLLPEQVWNEHRATTRGRDLDITGMSYAMLEKGPQQWPLPEGQETGRKRLYEDGVFPTENGRARFVATSYQPVSEPREARYPFSLTTGRLRDQWHGMSRTGTLGRLFGHVPEPVLQMHPQDMVRRNLPEGALVRVSSKRGHLVVPVNASEELGLSQTFMAMHWGSEFLSGRDGNGDVLAGVNALTTSAYCPTSKQPEFKHTAVRIEKADLPWTLLGLAWLPPDAAHEASTAIRSLMPHFGFATCVPFGRERTGILVRAASADAPDEEVLNTLEHWLGLQTADTLRYTDPHRGRRRAMRLVQSPGEAPANARLEAFLLAGDTQSEAWIKTLLQNELAAGGYGRQLLTPGGEPPPGSSAASLGQGRQICTCFNVGEQTIKLHLQDIDGADSDRLASLQNTLKCGTNCGSCVPELKKLVRQLPCRPTAQAT